MHPEWSPLGAERFIALIKDGVFDGTVIYRVVKDQAVQFGYPKDPRLREKWQKSPNLRDDPQIFANPNFRRGMISFAGGGPNTRGIDVFITFMTGNANGNPGAPWETPFGIIDEEGMRAVTSFTWEYGDFEGFGGHAPEMGKGYDSLKLSHPNIDYLGKCELVYYTPAPLPPATTAPSVNVCQRHQHCTECFTAGCAWIPALGERACNADCHPIATMACNSRATGSRCPSDEDRLDTSAVRAAAGADGLDSARQTLALGASDNLMGAVSLVALAVAGWLTYRLFSGHSVRWLLLRLSSPESHVLGQPETDHSA
jgi:cyclophilin family peptidyl-prolyl cis-trans isomerase